MRLLLDTHTFLWFIEGSLNLSDVARDLIEAFSLIVFQFQLFSSCRNPLFLSHFLASL